MNWKLSIAKYTPWNWDQSKWESFLMGVYKFDINIKYSMEPEQLLRFMRNVCHNFKQHKQSLIIEAAMLY